MENKEQVAQEQAQDKPKVVLLSSISYTDRNDYQAFLEGMSPEHAVVTLIAAANHAQGKGAYNLDEAELIAKAIRKLTAQDTASNETTVETAEAAPAAPEAAAKPAKKTTRSSKK